jgi:predicted DNA-binding ArsR family transcriptional regulator
MENKEIRILEELNSLKIQLDTLCDDEVQDWKDKFFKFYDNFNKNYLEITKLLNVEPLQRIIKEEPVEDIKIGNMEDLEEYDCYNVRELMNRGQPNIDSTPLPRRILEIKKV